MTRTRRSDLVHPFLHVYSRGADRQDIFTDDRDRVRFEELLGVAVERYGIAVHAYAFMFNHVHLVVDRSQADLSAAMQFVLARYAASYNHTSERTGPLFGGRYGATEITSDEQLLQCSRYVQLNPVGIVPIESLRTYRWSSLAVYAGRRPAPSWLTTERLPSLLHATTDAYVDWVLTPQPTDRHGRPTQPWATLTLHDVDQAVTRAADRIPGAADRQLLAIGLAIELRVAPSPEIASHHRLGSAVSARTTARRARVRVARDPRFADVFERTARGLRERAARAGMPDQLAA